MGCLDALPRVGWFLAVVGLALAVPFASALACPDPRTADPALRQRIWLGQGREAERNVEVKPNGAALAFTAEGDRCRFQIHVPFKARVSLQVTGASGKAMAGPDTLRKREGKHGNLPMFCADEPCQKTEGNPVPETVVRPQRVLADSTVFELEAGRYAADLPTRSIRSQVGKGPYRLKVVVEENREEHILVPQAGGRIAVTFNADTQSAWVRIIVEKRSRIVLDVREDTAPPQNFSYGARLFDDEGREFNADSVTRDKASGVSRIDVVLDPGTYRMKLLAGQFHDAWWFDEAGEKPRGALIVSVAEMRDAPLASDADALAEWVRSAGLNGVFGIHRRVDYREVAADDVELVGPLFHLAAQRRNLREAYRLAAEGADRDGVLAMRLGGPDMEDDPLKPQAGRTLEWLRERQVPRYLLLLRSYVDRHELRKFEREFKERHGVSVWQRLMEKYSLLTGIPVGDIVVDISVSCSGGLIGLLEGRFERQGRECMSASIGIDIPEPAGHHLLASARSAAVQPVANFPAYVEQYLQAALAKAGGRIAILTREDNYVQAIVRGLKGTVVSGSPYWERVSLSFALLQSERNARVRILADGMLATGIGGYPQDSQFTRSMEPEYAGPLTEYAARIADEFRQFVLARGPR